MARLSGKGEYVSRAGSKLASVAQALHLDFHGQLVLDVGSSTGGFSDYALQHGAKKVIAVDIGTNQLHPKLRADNRLELHEKTDIRDFRFFKNHELPTIIVMDISFMSLRLILPHVAQSLSNKDTTIVAMVKPQFEARPEQLNEGIVKNETMRREILKNFEEWARSHFVITAKKDSGVSGLKGNQEKFYILSKLY
jgi:23S rRNA (cytidine1920-2'-O)/16S rRNA (cytidine1409-2'-O)-methyltransferase